MNQHLELFSELSGLNYVICHNHNFYGINLKKNNYQRTMFNTYYFFNDKIFL